MPTPQPSDKDQLIDFKWPQISEITNGIFLFNLSSIICILRKLLHIQGTPTNTNFPSSFSSNFKIFDSSTTWYLDWEPSLIALISLLIAYS